MVTIFSVTYLHITWSLYTRVRALNSPCKMFNETKTVTSNDAHWLALIRGHSSHELLIII